MIISLIIIHYYISYISTYYTLFYIYILCIWQFQFGSNFVCRSRDHKYHSIGRCILQGGVHDVEPYLGLLNFQKA